MASFEQRISELRKKKGWSQDQLAEALGMNRANISNYERGIITNIPSDVLMKLSDIFRVSIDYLLGKSENSEPPVSEFIAKLNLSEDELLKNYSLVLDDKVLTKEEAMAAIAFLRTTRQMRN